jgi:hypothetical protein
MRYLKKAMWVTGDYIGRARDCSRLYQYMSIFRPKTKHRKAVTMIIYMIGNGKRIYTHSIREKI